MFMTIIVLTIVAVAFEIYLVGKVPFLLHVLEKYPIAALAFSLALSIFLGAVFGAAGLIVFVAGLCSTFLAQPYYRLKKKGTIDKANKQIADAKAKIQAKRDLYIARYNLMKNITIQVFNIVFFPVKITLKAIDWWNAKTSR